MPLTAREAKVQHPIDAVLFQQMGASNIYRTKLTQSTKTQKNARQKGREQQLVVIFGSHLFETSRFVYVT